VISSAALSLGDLPDDLLVRREERRRGSLRLAVLARRGQPLRFEGKEGSGERHEFTGGPEGIFRPGPQKRQVLLNDLAPGHSPEIE
jgi:hypothetical protein